MTFQGMTDAEIYRHFAELERSLMRFATLRERFGIGMVAMKFDRMADEAEQEAKGAKDGEASKT